MEDESYNPRTVERARAFACPGLFNEISAGQQRLPGVRENAPENRLYG